jgi:hypothetical protein
MQKAEIKLVTATEASIEVGGKAIGKITIALKEEPTIEGVDNAIVVLGNCENLQDSSHHGFAFHLIPNVITARKPVESPTIKGA